MEDHYYEADKEFCDNLLPCEEYFIYELLESGSTWANAKSLLAKQNEKFGKPVVTKEVTFKYGKVGKYYNWVIPESEPEPEA